MDLPSSIRKRFQQYGMQGGKARARALSPSDRRAIARRAAIRRWVEARFGVPRFAELGLPGGELIDAGLEDLAVGRETASSLAVSLAASRLRREGVPVPADTFPDADRRLYRLLEAENEALGHARYLAWLRQVASFADACRGARIAGTRHAT